jgi:hypothetical protein
MKDFAGKGIHWLRKPWGSGRKGKRPNARTCFCQINVFSCNANWAQNFDISIPEKKKENASGTPGIRED